MKGITIKLPEAVARQLREQARQSGRSVVAVCHRRVFNEFTSRGVHLESKSVEFGLHSDSRPQCALP
jgi:ABC-type lipoprotein export system ATPase subunit